MYESLHSRHEEISRPQASSQTISPREKWRQRPSQRLVLRCSPWNCPRSACSCHISQLQGLFQCSIPVMMMETNAPVCFTARCSCSSPCPVPNAISSFSPEQLGNVQAIYFLWFAFEFSIFFCQEMCIWGEPSFSSCCMKSFLWVSFLRLVWEKEITSPAPFPPFPKPQCMDYISPGVLHWVGTSFDITSLSPRFFLFSHFFSCLFQNQGWLTHCI